MLRLVRCDLHTHSRHSGPVDLPVLRGFVRECCSEPRAVYDTALRRGMDLVTLTDHDTIEGALALAHLPSFFIGEEVTVELAGRRSLHVGVFDITETQHDAIGRRRRDAESLFAYLAEQRIPACVNHLFSPLTGPRELGDFRLALAHLRLVETRNGMMPESTNEAALQVGAAAGLAAVGGSDGHTLATVGRAYTVVPGARDKQEFLAGLRQGSTLPAGRSGSYARLTADVLRIFAGAYVEHGRMALESPGAACRFAAIVAALPVIGLVPLFTLASHVGEVLRGRDFARRFAAQHPGPALVRPSLGGPPLAVGRQP